MRLVLRLDDDWAAAGFDFSSEGPDDGLDTSARCIDGLSGPELYPALDMAVSARLPFLGREVADGAGAGGSAASTLTRLLVRLEAEARAGSGSWSFCCSGLVSRAAAFRFRVEGGARAGVVLVLGWAGD